MEDEKFNHQAFARIVHAINDPLAARQDADQALAELAGKLSALEDVFGAPALVEPRRLVEDVRRLVQTVDNGHTSSRQELGQRLVDERLAHQATQETSSLRRQHLVAVLTEIGRRARRSGKPLPDWFGEASRAALPTERETAHFEGIVQHADDGGVAGTATVTLNLVTGRPE